MEEMAETAHDRKGIDTLSAMVSATETSLVYQWSELSSSRPINPLWMLMWARTKQRIIQYRLLA